MNLKQFGVLLCALCIAMTPVAYGGEPKSVYVYAEDVGDDGRVCGLSKSSIVSAAAYLLQESGFSLMPETRGADADFDVYINVNVMHIKQIDHCVASVDVEFHTLAPSFLPWNQKPALASIDLCSKGYVQIARSSEASASVRDSIEELTKACIVKLKTPKS